VRRKRNGKNAGMGFATLFGVAALMISSVTASEHCSTQHVRSRLEQLHQRDADFRRGSGPDRDADNIVQLKQIVARCGWPVRSQHGERAVQAAFLVVQHAGLEDQLQLLPLLEQAEIDGELAKGLLPLLHDRVRVRQGRPQLYGTQLQGACVPYPIDDPDGLELRRQAAGLMPLADYLAICRERPLGGAF
jgi:hypothetical protein